MSKKELFPAIDVTPQAIKDFQACELYYKLEHEIDEPMGEIYHQDKIMTQRYEEILRKLAFFYFHKKQGGLTPSYGSLIRRWERLWFPKDMTAYDMSIQPQKTRKVNLKDFSNMAVAAIESFYDEFDDNLATPICIDESVIVPVSKNIRLIANHDLVLYEDGRFNVIHFIGTRRNVPMSPYKIDLAFNRLGFEHHHNENQIANTTYHIYNLGNPSTGFHKVDEPSDSDMTSCLYWANEIANKQQFVPRRGFSSYCRGCKFDSQCLEYEWKEAVNE